MFVWVTLSVINMHEGLLNTFTGMYRKREGEKSLICLDKEKEGMDGECGGRDREGWSKERWRWRNCTRLRCILNLHKLIKKFKNSLPIFIQIFISIFQCTISWSYLPNPSARAGYDTRSIFKRSLTGLNSEFSFS